MKSKLFSAKNALILAMLIIITGNASYLYWEFVRDIYPEEAINFFKYQSNLNEYDNAAFALAGVRAPSKENNFIQWAINRHKYLTSMSRSKYSDIQLKDIDKSLRGKNPESIPYKKTAELSEPKEGFHYICWLPSGSDQIDRCITEDEMDFILEENIILLNRYKTVLNIKNIDLNIGPALHQFSMELTKQYSVELWKRKDTFTPNDLNEIAKLLWFWKKISDSQFITTVDFAVAMVNYGLALELFYQTALLYPKVIEIFTTDFGGFDVFPADQSVVDRISIGELYWLLPEICINRSFAYKKTDSCENLSDLIFKPGRTIDLIYRNKPKIDNCKNSEEGHNNKKEFNISLIARLLKRPGNFQGRVYALYGYTNHSFICDVIKNYTYQNETIGLFALHNKIRHQNLTHEEITKIYESKKELFRIPFSNHFYKWDSTEKNLIYIRPESEQAVIYELPITK